MAKLKFQTRILQACIVAPNALWIGKRKPAKIVSRGLAVAIVAFGRSQIEQRVIGQIGQLRGGKLHTADSADQIVRSISLIALQKRRLGIDRFDLIWLEGQALRQLNTGDQLL